MAEHDEYFRIPEPADAMEDAHDAGLHEYAEALAHTKSAIDSGDDGARREMELAEEEREGEQQFRSAQVEAFCDELEAAFLAADEDGEE